MSNKDQVSKYTAGVTLSATVEKILSLMKTANLITDYRGDSTSLRRSPHFGYPQKEKQFRCDYIYRLKDGKSILVR